MPEAKRCQFCGETGDPCVCGGPLRPLPITSSPAIAYPDCVYPAACECLDRGYPRPHKLGCVVPAINATADRLGWKRPYPDVPVPVEPNNPEIGRELSVDELKPGTIVVVAPPQPGDKPLFITIWVKSANRQVVVFRSGKLGTDVVNFVQPDGTLRDGHYRPVRFFEYLGTMSAEWC